LKSFNLAWPVAYCTIIITFPIVHVGIIIATVALAPVLKCCNLEFVISASINAPLETKIVLLAIRHHTSASIFPAAKIGVTFCTLIPCTVSENSFSHGTTCLIFVPRTVAFDCHINAAVRWITHVVGIGIVIITVDRQAVDLLGFCS
jgi:hypothetical protein